MSFVLRDLSFSYGDRSIFQHLSADIPDGCRLAVLGPSGIGKTTLLSVLGLLWEPRKARLSGEILFSDRRGDRHSYAALGDEVASRLRRDQFGFALQSSYLLPHFSVAENIGMPLGLQGFSPRMRAERSRRLLRDADLEHLWQKLPRDLSGGERQRIAVLRAVVHDPQVVFADEPFSSLDNVNRDYILELLSRWQSGQLVGQERDTTKRTLIMVCHDPETAESCAEVILRLGPRYSFEMRATVKPPANLDEGACAVSHVS